jgi:DegV family protein with EDD domain
MFITNFFYLDLWPDYFNCSSQGGIMPKVAVVTDSTAYIPDELLEQYGIRVAPQVLIWGDQTLLDGVDIKPEEFYTRLLKDKVYPSTSQVTPGAFQKIFKELAESGKDILAVLISKKLSGTIESAVQACELLPGANIEIVDSQSAGMGLGFQALAAARAADQGASLAECKALAEKAVEQTGVVFAVNTLEFLHRGGRIGGATRYLGTALNIKPILELRDGRVEAIERVRTRKRSLARLIELVEERVADRQPVRLAVLHANAPEDAQALLVEANARLQAIETIFTSVSPVVGNHAGPGTVGLAYMVGM